MNEQELDVLLYRGESDVLDYKSAQYTFIGAPDVDKVELLKDCLAFANSWRREPGYIVIGVTKNLGQPAHVVGIPKSDHIDDAKLQQFVNSKTNAPVRLLYEEVDYKGLSVGLIRFEYPQQRPVYLKKAFERLRQDIVYIRRGSSTDECKPDEIAQMGAAVTPSKRLDFGLGFADVETNRSLGTTHTVAPIAFDRPAWVDVPEPRNPAPIEIPTLSMFGGRKRTKAEKFDAVQDIARFAPVRFQVTNDGTGTAEDIEVHVNIAAQDGLELADAWNPPSKKYRDPISQITGVNVHIDANVDRTPDGWSLRLTCKKLHAQQVMTFDPVYFASTNTTTITLQSRIFAHDLPEPIERQLALTIAPKQMEYQAEFPKQFGL